jgi:predicted ATP-dependent Lon-type protease
MLMGHNTGLAINYYRPNENEILDDYLKAIPILTINDEYRLKQENTEVRQKQKIQEKWLSKLEERFNASLDIHINKDTIIVYMNLLHSMIWMQKMKNLRCIWNHIEKL